jgi:hypothetical protein
MVTTNYSVFTQSHLWSEIVNRRRLADLPKCQDDTFRKAGVRDSYRVVAFVVSIQRASRGKSGRIGDTRYMSATVLPLMSSFVAIALLGGIKALGSSRAMDIATNKGRRAKYVLKGMELIGIYPWRYLGSTTR